MQVGRGGRGAELGGRGPAEGARGALSGCARGSWLTPPRVESLAADHRLSMVRRRCVTFVTNFIGDIPLAAGGVRSERMSNRETRVGHPAARAVDLHRARARCPRARSPCVRRASETMSPCMDTYASVARSRPSESSRNFARTCADASSAERPRPMGAASRAPSARRRSPDDAETPPACAAIASAMSARHRATTRVARALHRSVFAPAAAPAAARAARAPPEPTSTRRARPSCARRPSRRW